MRPKPRPTPPFLALLALVALGAAPAPDAVPVLYETVELHASDGERDDWFGHPVALEGDRLVVGAVRDDDRGTDAGAAYIFERNEGEWVETAKVFASDAEAGDGFGSVALSGTVVVVGAEGEDDLGLLAGAAYVFELDPNGTWAETIKLLPSDGRAGDNFGDAVAIDGDTVVVGADTHDTPAGEDAGAAWVFERSETGEWVETAKLTASDGQAEDRFGFGVAIDDDRIVAGALGVDDQGVGSGAAYVFERDGVGRWVETAKLLPSDGDAFFGGILAIDGDTIAVSDTGSDDLGLASGAAYVFERDGDGSWQQTAKLFSPDPRPFDDFGRVALDGDLLVVGAEGGNPQPGINSGTADLFRRDADGWNHVSRLLPSDGRDQDQFGIATAIDGDTVVVGARLDDFWGPDSGSVYIFELEECRLKLQLEPGAVRVGDELRVGILLEHNRPETVTVPFRVWIEDAEGGVVASRTTEPQTFHHGDSVRRELTLRIPEGTPAGEYRVLVGVERMQQGLAGAERSFTVLGPAPPTLVPPSR